MAQPNAGLVLEAYKGISQAQQNIGKAYQDTGNALTQTLQAGANAYLQNKQLDLSDKHNTASEKIAQQNANTHTSQVAMQNKATQQNIDINSTNATISKAVAKALNTKAQGSKQTIAEKATQGLVSDPTFLKASFNPTRSNANANQAPHPQPPSTQAGGVGLTPQYTSINNGGSNHNMLNLPLINGNA